MRLSSFQSATSFRLSEMQKILLPHDASQATTLNLNAVCTAPLSRRARASARTNELGVSRLRGGDRFALANQYTSIDPRRAGLLYVGSTRLQGQVRQ